MSANTVELKVEPDGTLVLKNSQTTIRVAPNGNVDIASQASILVTHLPTGETKSVGR